MTPQQLTTPERLALLAKIDEDERQLQEEWGTTWDKLVQDYEQRTADLLTNPQQ